MSPAGGGRGWKHFRIDCYYDSGTAKPAPDTDPGWQSECAGLIFLQLADIIRISQKRQKGLRTKKMKVARMKIKEAWVS
jgi:hypothetical protein